MTACPSSTLKVMLIEDSCLLQEMLFGMLNELEDIELCSSAVSEDEALQLLEVSPVDLVVIDLSSSREAVWA